MLVLVTVVMHWARDESDNQAHVVLTYLLVVLGGSVSGGRPLGLTLAGISFLLIDYYFQYPFDQFAISKPLDGIVLAAFLATAYTATELLARARSEAEQARHRATEIEHLSDEARRAEALREAARLKDVMLASLSHDLRTPLTTIKALAQDLAASGDANAAIIAAQADRLSRMVADLLDLSRLNAGAFPVTRELNTAEDLVGAALHQLAGSPGVDRIRTEVDYSRPALIGSFDFVQSLRILTNLLENALLYSPEDTLVTLAATRASEWLEFTVQDSGMGIPTGEGDQIFEPFYRHPSTSAGVKGTGLGLAIARRLAEAQGGSVCHSPRDGGGTVFTLRLPALDT